MNFIKTSVKRRVTIAMIFLCVVLLGGVSVQKIGLDLFPSMEMPITLVMTSYPGASSEEVEQMVTKPMESTLGTVQGVESISSTSATNSSMIMVQFNWGTDLDFAGLDIREKIDLVKGSLPDDVSEPVIMKMDPSMMPVITLSISGSNNLAELKSLVENEIQPVIERQAGVASVQLGGGLKEQIDVVVSPTTLNLYGISMDTIVQSIQRNNMNMAAGNVIDNNENMTIRVLGKYDALADIENVNVVLPSGESVLLKDLAEVKLVQEEGDYEVWQNGEECVYLAISKQSDANTVTTSDNVKAALENLQSELPPNVQINTIFDQADMIQMTIDSLVNNLLVGAFLAIAILFLFLRSIRSTLVIAISIPISLISTFVLMYFTGMTLNMMTLGGLALGTGMMVDSSIVILENIQRMRTNGLDGDKAAIKGASQIVMAVVASTITTVAVFVPIVFMDGMAAMIFKDLALTVTFSLLASMVVAVTLVPMLCARLLKPEVDYQQKYGNKIGPKVGKVQGGFLHLFDKVKNIYRRILSWSLNHRKTVVFSIMGLFIASFGLLGFVGMEFIPSSDAGQITVSIELKEGTEKTKTLEVARQVENIIQDVDQGEIDTMLTLVGGSSSSMMSGGSGNTAEISITMVGLEERERSSAQLAEEIRKKVKDIPGAEISISAGDMTSSMGMSGASVSVAIHGEDLDTLKSLGELVKTEMEKVPGSREITSSLDEGLPELHIEINDNKVAAMGLSVAQVANAISSFIDGQTASTYTNDNGTDIDIIVKLPEGETDDLESILDMQISTATGAKLTLRDVAEIQQGTGPISIAREDQERLITVSCDLVDVDINTFTNQLERNITQNIVIPEGYSIEQTGSYEEMIDAFTSLFLGLILGIILVYMVMASLFESLSQPFIIMFSIPTAFIGVFVGLFLTQTSLNVTTFIGIIMLMGIVVNNGIVLVDYVNTLRREQGMNCREALLIAGPVRLRPILMTALTTILGMLPMMFSQAEGADLSRGMAVAVGFGLTASTFFTLVFVPVIYSIFDDYSQRAKLKAIHKEAKLQAKITGHDVKDIEARLLEKRKVEWEKTGGLPPKKKRRWFGKKKQKDAAPTAIDKLKAEKELAKESGKNQEK